MYLTWCYVLYSLISLSLTNELNILTDWQKNSFLCMRNYFEFSQPMIIHQKYNITFYGLEESGYGVRQIVVRSVYDFVPERSSFIDMLEQDGGYENYYRKLVRKVDFHNQFMMFAERQKFKNWDYFVKENKNIKIFWCKNGLCEDCRSNNPIALAIINEISQPKNTEVQPKIQASEKMWSDGQIEDFKDFSIELASNSLLIGRPGDVAKLYFRVINRLWQPLEFFFECYAQIGIIRAILPTRIIIPPNSPSDIEVFLEVGGSEGSIDQITFIVNQQYQEFIRVNFYIGQMVGDTSRPTIDYTFNGDCRYADTPHTCGSEKWSIEAVIRDENSGLANIYSIPNHLRFQNDFIIGTREAVIVYYSSTCCFPKVEIIATDLRGNIKKKTIDAEKQYLNLAEIAAIILAIFVLFFTIIILIWAVLRCRKRRKSQNFISN
ncbi:uncharacterized protein LOC126908344 [Daktulosphaira vitifoliae]|uniref:uncharacterized protein LOC126908344 n=1 Tax=Daktulosphaira vitifoliae TaxID=58002 RepID=UPI0021AA28B4|nr:uncharacterized protein LOC126908344 [Daktulosphaira vitifoliae]